MTDVQQEFTESKPITAEVRRRNMIVGTVLFTFALSVGLGAFLLLSKTRYNPFVERPQFLIKPER